MGVTWTEAENCLDDAVKELFQNPTTRAVGIGPHGDGYGFHVIRNTAKITPMAATFGIAQTMIAPAMIRNVPVSIFDRHAEVEAHIRLPFSGPGSPGVASLVPEQLQHTPVVCGLQIENYDDDIRTGTIAGGHIIVGSIGCFVVLPSGHTAILSNNHVVAGENRGLDGTDRIMQPGNGTAANQIATLTTHVALVPSPTGATPASGGVTLNDVDAGVATLLDSVTFRQDYLSTRKVAPPSGWAVPALHDEVYKVGRTTGLTLGTVTSVSTVVGPILYAPGECWFRRTITIEGKDGTMFSDHGDSGSAIIKSSTGQVIGLLFAGNGTDTFACPIDAVLGAFNCRIA